MDPDLAGRLKAEAGRLGLDFCGIAPAVVPPGYPRFLDWLEQGCAAGMAYLGDKSEARRHPEAILPGVRSVVIAGFVYGEPTPRRRGRRGRSRAMPGGATITRPSGGGSGRSSTGSGPSGRG